MHPSVENRFYDLLGRKLTGECPALELEELESILQRHPELQLFYNQIVTHSSEVSAIDIETAYIAHRAKMYPGQSPSATKEEGVMSKLFQK